MIAVEDVVIPGWTIGLLVVVALILLIAVLLRRL
jgi:hypothetical protein